MNRPLPARTPGHGRGSKVLPPLLLGLFVACASQSTSSGRPAPPDAPVVQQAELRELFDPRQHRADEFLIEPTFAPPPSASGADTPVPTPVDEDLEFTVPISTNDGPQLSAADGGPLASPPSTGGESAVAYRVQIMVLSDETTARVVADQLQRDLYAPVQVVEDAGLFAVRAGDSSSPEAAAVLKEQIVSLGPQYAEAFVLTEEVSSQALFAADESAPDAVESSDEPVEEPWLVRTTGWRVLLREFQRLDEATAYKQRVMRRLQRSDSDLDVVFEPPWYKILMGHFRTEGEAQAAAEKLREMGYRSAVKTRGEVYLPEDGR